MVVTDENIKYVRSLVVPKDQSQLNTDELNKEIKKHRKKIYSRLRFAILNAIPHEHAAILSIFGNPEYIPSRENPDSSIKYVKLQLLNGEDMYVVLAGITGQGIAQAAAMTAQVQYKCRHVKKIILVGIAAGQPNLTNKEKDVRLGDIVVSNRILQYDHVKLDKDGTELRGDAIAPGDSGLMCTVDELRACQELDIVNRTERSLPWIEYIKQGEKSVRNAVRPDKTKDVNYEKRNYEEGLEYEKSDSEPYVHVGTIGSASTLLKHAEFRDKLHLNYKTIAYEMEGAGVAIAAASSGIDYLMVRGICDYADENKDDAWQTYASVCAAAFARAILEAQ
ncbi:MAG: phosphorylase [Rhodomicrobiaceae bacterium]